MERKALAICVPTYNRKDKLLPRIMNLLLIEDNRFYIVVKDNCSTDGTKEELKSIKDSRLIYIENENNVGGQRNPWQTLLEGTKYAYNVILCLDKDRIEAHNLSDFINFLIKERPKVGYADLNLKTDAEKSVVGYKKDSLKRMGYIFRHPTGYFYDAESYKKTLKEVLTFDELQTFPFVFDIIAAHISAQNNSFVYSKPLVFTETRDEVKIIKSFTYNSDNLHFSPKYVQYEFPVFLRDLYSLPIDKKQIINKAQSLLWHMLLKVSLSYKTIMSNEELCEHHGIDTQKINYTTMIKNLLPVGKTFIYESKRQIGLFRSYFVVISESCFALLVILKNCIRK